MNHGLHSVRWIAIYMNRLCRYSSSLKPFLQQGSLLYIDDYFAGLKGSPLTGPAAAFREFESRTEWRFADHMRVGWWGRSFIAYQ